jgi:hypothetical protein
LLHFGHDPALFGEGWALHSASAALDWWPIFCPEGEREHLRR